MASRYINATKKTIYLQQENNETLSDLLIKRNVNQISFYQTTKLKDLTNEQISFLNFEEHIWKHNDKFWKLSSQYYNNPSYWWIIAWFNQTPTEAHIKLGEVIYIPTPLTTILGIYNG